MLQLLLACSPSHTWALPEHVAPPAVPDNNPLTPQRIALGQRLFYDTRLSMSGDMSCATCHQQSRAFTDGRARSVGSTGEVHPRGAMSLANVAYAPRLTWANPQLGSLEVQAMLPLFGDDPVEMGMTGTELVSRLSADADYTRWFAAAWPRDDAPVSVENTVAALAGFQRTLLSFGSPYDHYVAGEGALSAAEQRGMALFFSERLGCFRCHGGFSFTDHADTPADEATYHHTALYDLDGAGRYPADNTGVFEITAEPADMGRFKAPTLRNVAVTAPYMHDGSISTLPEVLDHYAAGGRAPGSPLKSPLLTGFVLTEAEKADVVAFLEALTDPGFLTDSRFSDPWGD